MEKQWPSVMTLYITGKLRDMWIILKRTPSHRQKLHFSNI